MLSQEEEEKVVLYLKSRAAMGIPLTKYQLCDTVEQIFVSSGRKNPFKDNRPGRHWVERFMMDHPTLQPRKPAAISKKRKEITAEEIKSWFSRCHKFLEEMGATAILNDPSWVFNCDESGFPLNGHTGCTDHVLAAIGSKNVYRMEAGSKMQITVLASFNAAGLFLPPYIIMPGSYVNGAAAAGKKKGVSRSHSDVRGFFFISCSVTMYRFPRGYLWLFTVRLDDMRKFFLLAGYVQPAD